MTEKTIPLEDFDKALGEYRAATDLTRSDTIAKLINAVDQLGSTRKGMEHLYNHIVPMIDAGIFKGTAWHDPSKLVAPLVKGTLQYGHPTSSIELLSELRMLAYAKKLTTSDLVSDAEAGEFVAEVLILNLEFALHEPSEESRLRMCQKELKKAFQLFSFILAKVDLVQIQELLAEEIDLICHQRPVVTRRVRELVALLAGGFKFNAGSPSGKKLTTYINAVQHPTSGSRKHSALNDYATFLENASKKALAIEAAEMGTCMASTGLVSQYHAILLCHLTSEAEHLVPACFALSEMGTAEWEEHKFLIVSLIRENVSVHNSQCIYGLSCMTNRGIFSDNAVKMALENLRKIRIHPSVEVRILKSNAHPSPLVTARQYLLSATFRVLGQPLGVGQGNNPTCQSARGISMWSQHTPARLINLIITTATQNKMSFRFEDQELTSTDLGKGLLDQLDYNLDAVSVVLVPHLDRIYNEMMKRASGRFEDPHKWVNPAMYGEWIQIGFASAYDYLSNSILDYQGFLRTFYASFHLDYNGNRQMVYPNPVGIFLTSVQGVRIGFHAVSLLRIQKSPAGQIRAYFLNPNNEGRQDWGQGIQPSVFGEGEVHGESSLPFHEFAARVYAFHYNHLESDRWKSKVPNHEIAKVETLARESWGKSYIWIQQPKVWQTASSDSGALNPI